MSDRRGRPRKPTAQKELEGTDRKDRAPANEPKPDVEDPGAPSWLSQVAKEEWDRVAPYLLRLGLLTHIDRAALAAYCQNFARWHDAEKLIAENGLVMKTPNEYEQQRPEIGIANTAMKQMKAFMVEFGMTPSARSGITVNENPNTPKDPWDELAKRRAARSA